MIDYADLIERLEKATGPDRELDADIGVLFRYHTSGPSHWLNGDDVTFFRGNEFQGAIGATCNGHDCGRWKAPRYTASLDAAVALFERELPGWTIDFISDDVDETGKFKGALVQLMEFKSNEIVRGEGKTRALALCLAILRAKKALPNAL